jgi:hypothetical protein
MGAQGHPRAIFERAIEHGKLPLAEVTVREFGIVSLHGALSLVALAAERGSGRRSRYALRWLRRLLEEAKNLTTRRRSRRRRWARSAGAGVGRLDGALNHRLTSLRWIRSPRGGASRCAARDGAVRERFVWRFSGNLVGHRNRRPYSRGPRDETRPTSKEDEMRRFAAAMLAAAAVFAVAGANSALAVDAHHCPYGYHFDYTLQLCVPNTPHHH